VTGTADAPVNLTPLAANCQVPRTQKRRRSALFHVRESFQRPVPEWRAIPGAFGLVQAYGRFRERVIEGIPDGSYRGRQAGQRQRLCKMHACILASCIRMMNGIFGYRMPLPRPVCSGLAYR
jgi:hypothetical protein